MSIKTLLSDRLQLFFQEKQPHSKQPTLKFYPEDLQAGFTLIEVLVVTSLSVFLILTATTLFMTSLISQSQINNQLSLKQEGNRTLRQLEFLLRNGQKVTPCTGATVESISVIDLRGETTIVRIDNENGRLASSSDKTYYLTSEDTQVDELQFTCNSGVDAPPYVEMTFSLSRADNTGPKQTDDTLTFSNGVSLRNFQQ